MTFDEYLASLPEKTSAVKTLVLRTLWETGGPGFPRAWVESSRLLALTRQKYFDRRIRELRDQVGCEIETGYHAGESAYRLVSAELGAHNPRGYLTPKQKLQLFQGHDHRCAVCGRQVPSGETGLEADHKVPLNRQGSHEFSNWQPLCTECNVSKRRACQGCEFDCGSCPWAYPERMGGRLVIRISARLRERLRGTNLGAPEALEAWVAERLELYSQGEHDPG